MAGTQIDFHEKQRHPRSVEVVLWVISIACVIFVLLAIFLVGGQGPPAA